MLSLIRVTRLQAVSQAGLLCLIMVLSPSVSSAVPNLLAFMPEGADPVQEIHGNPTPPFPVLGDGHHFRWFGLDEDLSTPGITDVSYSFTWTAAVIGFFGGADTSNAAQKARVRDSFAAWEAVTPGLRFIELGGTATISAGTAADFITAGFAGALGLGGGLGSVHLGGADTGVNHHLTDALAVQNGAITWNNSAAAPGATEFDYLTVATQEDAHTFGLDHNAGDTSSVMFPFLAPGIRRTPNGSDAASSNFLYPVGAVPEPSSLLLLGSGLFGLAGWRWRKTRAATS